MARIALLAALLAAAALAGANAASVGPWTPFSARAEAAQAPAKAAGVSTAAGVLSAYAEDYYKRAVKASFETGEWRLCDTENYQTSVAVTVDLVCPAARSYGDSYGEGFALNPAAQAVAMTCSGSYLPHADNIERLVVSINTGGTIPNNAINIGRVSATCRATTGADECGAPINKHLVIGLEGDLYVAFVRSTVNATVTPPVDSATCPDLPARRTAPRVGTPSAPAESVRAQVADYGREQHYGRDEEQYGRYEPYYHYDEHTLYNGVALLLSGTSSTVGLKDKDLNSVGLWEAVPAVYTGNNFCRVPILGDFFFCTGTTTDIPINYPAKAPLVDSGATTFVWVGSEYY